MSTSNKEGQAAPVTTSSNHSLHGISFPWSIGIAGIGIFTIIAFAILLPEYWRYQFQTAQLEFQKEQLKQAEKSIQQINSPPAATQQTTNTNSSNTSQPPPVVNTQSPTSNIKPNMPSVDSSALFESYTRFITLLVGLLSVIGVFFGYFVRRSVKETEEDMDKRLTKSLEGWEKERDEIKRTYNKNVEEVVELRQGLQGLKGETENLLSTLNEAIKRFQEPPPTREPDIKAAAAILDNDLADSEGSNE